VVAHLVRLKLALLRNMFRRSRAQAIGAVIGIVYFAVLVAGLTVILASLRTSLEAGRVVIPLAGAAGTVLWTVVPLFSFGSDPTLDPGRFATFAVPHRDLAVGLVAAALVGLPAIASVVLCVGVVIAWSHTVVATVVAIVATTVGLLTAVTTSRWISAVMTHAISSRRGRDVIAVLGLVIVVATGPVASLVANLDHDLRDVATTAARVVAWTPLGWAWAAPGDVAAGQTATGIVRLALAVGLLAVVGGLWSRVVRDQVDNPRAVSRADSGASTGDDLGFFDRLPGTPMGAVAARVLTYWRRDPRYQIAMAMTPLLPLAPLIPYYTGDLSWAPLLMGPLTAFLLGWSEHNAVAYEGDALWLHIVAGTSGRDDRRGRLVPDALLATALVPVYAGVGVAVTGRWDLLVPVLGLALSLLGAGYAVSSVMSVVMPYPVPASGESPFTAPPGAAGITMAAQSLASVGTLALASPVVLLAWLAWQGSDAAAWATGSVGAGLGATLAFVGIRGGARLYDRRAPELLAALRRT
jgi:ABC-2 type transport system permease protein